MVVDNSNRALLARKLETELVHAAVSPEPASGAVLTPLFLSTTFVQDVFDVAHGECICQGGYQGVALPMGARHARDMTFALAAPSATPLASFARPGGGQDVSGRRLRRVYAMCPLAM